MDPTRSSAGKGRQRALVVEPDRRVADAVVDALSGCGYVASVARSPREALMAINKPPRVVLLDAVGPIEPTVELLQAFQRVHALRSVPVLGTHGRRPPDRHRRDELRRNGVLAFVELPLDVTVFKEALAGSSGDSLPPLLPDAGAARPRMISPRLEARPAPAARRATDPNVAAIGGSGVAAGMEFAGIEATCAVVSASARQLILRTDGPFPPTDVAVRVFISFRDVVDDSMRDLPVRVLGRVLGIDPSGRTRRVRVEVRVATPSGNFEKLVRYLLRRV